MNGFVFLQLWQETAVKLYFKLRYGPSWLWYWTNWEVNGEFLP